MRAFPTSCRVVSIGATCALILGLGSPAHAEPEDTTAAIQIELVEARQHVNNLYAQAAVASERLNGAIFELGEMKKLVASQQESAEKAAADVTRDSSAVAELTVQDLQSNSGVARLGSFLDSAGPSQLLERSNAYGSTREALHARIDALRASEVVYASARARADEAIEDQRAAVLESEAAKTAIESSIAGAEQAERDLETERPVMLERLAESQGVSVAEVTQRQDRIDRELDARPGVPSTPPATTQPGPGPSQPAPSEPAPSEPDRPPAPKPPAPAPKPPPPSAGKVETAISYARAQLGKPYRWGGAGPNSFDCSGLTMRAYGAVGVGLPHYAGAQYSSTNRVSVGSRKRGDLLFWSNGGSGSIYHVAIYLGGGQMIHAPRSGRDVEIVPLSYWIMPDLASRV